MNNLKINIRILDFFYLASIIILVDRNIAGWSSLVARRAHNPKVVGSNPAPAILFAQIAQLVEQGTENPCVAGSIPALGICSSKRDKQYELEH